jgi:transposase
VANVIMENIGKGMPLFRIEDGSVRDGVAFDRGSLSRWKKTGERLGATVICAMRQHALAAAFCISTDATGVCVQPIPNDRTRQPCKKGHFLVQIADRDHILFDYLERETSEAIYTRFRSFSGYVQADAKSVFNLLFADAEALKASRHDVESDGCERVEVACWYHARRRFWEAAVAKSEVAREGLMRMARIFELDDSWKKKPPVEIAQLRMRDRLSGTLGRVSVSRVMASRSIRVLARFDALQESVAPIGVDGLMEQHALHVRRLRPGYAPRNNAEEYILGATREHRRPTLMG